MAGYDLICTYNWGAMDAALAHTLFADFYKLPPLVHHEDGFDEDEANGLKASRNLYRRFALGRREERTDSCAIGDVQDAFRESDGDVRVLLTAIATSPAFLERTETPTE